MSRPALATALVLCIAAFAGCGDEGTGSVTGPTTVTLTTEYFQGSLAVNGTRFFSFTIATGGTASFMLASVTSPHTGAALPVLLGLGTGIPAGTGCAVSEAIETSGALQAQHVRALAPGIHCVALYDIGHLTSDVNFAIRFTHP